VALSEILRAGTPEELLDALREAALVVDTEGRVAYVNAAAEALLRWSAAALVGCDVATVVRDGLPPAASGSGVAAGARRTTAITQDGAEIAIDVVVSLAAVAEVAGGAVVTIRPAARSAVPDLSEQLLRVVADRRGDGSDGRRVLQAIGSALAWDVSVLWVPDDGKRFLRSEALWRAPSAHVERLEGAIAGSLLPPGTGLAGRSWESGGPVWAEDLPATSMSPVEDVAVAAGIRSSVAFPVTAGGSFVGVIQLLHHAARPTDPVVVDVLTSTGALVGEFLERMWHDEERRRLLGRVQTERARLEAVQRRMPSAVLVADAPSGRVVAGNDKLDEILGAPQVVNVDGERVLEYRFVGPDGIEIPRAELPFARAARTGAVIDDAEYVFLGPDGLSRTISVSASPVHDRDGLVVSAVATFHDVTARRRVADRHRFLAEASAALATSLQPHTGLEAVARLAVGVLGDVVAVHLADSDGVLRLLTSAHADARVAEVDRRLQQIWRFDPDAPEGLARAVRTGEPLVYDRIDAAVLEATVQDVQYRALLDELGIRSAMVVPLRAGGSSVGTLSFVSVQPVRVFDADAVALAEDVARRASLAIGNARLYERERATAAILQASLLPRSLPSPAGVDIGASFHPGGEGLVVGGDFYDVFPVGSGTAVVVGDVCGKGAEAAALTSQVRFSARALSDPGRDPATVLGLVDAKVREAEYGFPGRFCTAVYALVERVDGGVECSVSSAGHPLPLVVRATGAVEELDCRGSLLFVLDRPTHRVATCTLAPGDALVLYTDGVTEARGPAGMFGDGGLAAALAAAAGRSAAELASCLAESAIAHSGGRAADDMAVVVVAAGR